MFDHKFTIFLSDNSKDDTTKYMSDYIVKNWNKLKNDVSYFLNNLDFIQIDIKNGRRIKSICKCYDWELNQHSENEAEDYLNLAKVDGVKLDKLNSLRIYIGVDIESKIFTFVFMDPHHLAIPSRHQGLDSITYQNQTFNRCKYNTKHIYEVIDPNTI
mgnify:FL=1